MTPQLLSNDVRRRPAIVDDARQSPSECWRRWRRRGIKTSVIALQTRMDNDDDGGKAIDAGGGTHAIRNAVTTTTQRRCVLCARENSANGSRNGRRNDVRCGGGVSGDATMASTSQGKEATVPNQNRRDESDATMTSQEKLKRRGEVASKGARR
jgi:hypothetical protein